MNREKQGRAREYTKTEHTKQLAYRGEHKEESKKRKPGIIFVVVGLNYWLHAYLNMKRH